MAVTPSGNGSGIFNSDPDTYAADVQQSECLRQGDIAVANAYLREWPVGQDPHDGTFAASMQAAQVAHLRRCYASAQANGHDLAGLLSGLRSLNAQP